MNGDIEIRQLARSITKEQRKQILMSFKETELHRLLKELFSRMEPNYVVEVTHGAAELGKDLVIVRKDSLSTEVIAVIVKMGDIRAKTAGDVDGIKNKASGMLSLSGYGRKFAEIESQIQQAISHPAEVKTIFSKLPVSHVIVVLCGGISQQPRRRLESELSQLIKIYDIEWLVDNFTEYYPQVFFEANAIDFLQEKISNLESEKHWISKKTGKNLSEYFIDPIVQEPDPHITSTKDKLSLSKKRSRFSFSEVLSRVEHVNRVILCGDPGSGKSMALSKIAIDMYRDAYKEATRTKQKKTPLGIPVLVSARDLLNVDDERELKEKCSLRPEIEKLFKVELLMVDALDEVASGERESLIEKAQRSCESLNCRLIVTSRKIDIIENPPKGFKKYELLPFEFGQAIRLFQKLVSNEKTLHVLRDGLERIKHQIPMVPLSLVLLIELVEEHREVPSSATELYDRFFDLVLGRYDKERGIEVLFEYIIKKRFLGRLAYEKFLEEDSIEIDRAQFDLFLEEYADIYGWKVHELEIFSKEIDRAGILSIKNTVMFRHRSFLDYCIAYDIFSRREEFSDINEMIVKRYFDDLWREVSFYYVGLRREVDKKLLSSILEYGGLEVKYLIGKVLIGRLLQAGWHSPVATRIYGIQKGLDLAPELRDCILSLLKQADKKAPKIFADFVLLSLAEISYDSIFLINEEKALFDVYLGEPSEQNLYKMVISLWGMKRLLNQEELRERISCILNVISDAPGLLSDEERARLYLMLMIIELDDATITKKIGKKLRKILKGSPKITNALLPPKRTGYRS